MTRSPVYCRGCEREVKVTQRRDSWLILLHDGRNDGKRWYDTDACLSDTILNQLHNLNLHLRQKVVIIVEKKPGEETITKYRPVKNGT